MHVPSAASLAALRPPGWVPPRRWWACVPCDVRWQAHEGEPCWSCGGPGEAAYQPSIFGGAHYSVARAER